MATITVELDEEKAIALQEKAARFGLRPEELVAASIESLIAQPDAAYDDAAKRVLSKNRELYRRLA